MAIQKLILRYRSWESSEEIAERLIEDLKERNLWRKNLLFRVMNRKFLRNITRYGIDNPEKESYDFFNEKSLREYDPNLAIKHIIEDFRRSVITVYDGEKLRSGEDYHSYKFKDSENKKEALIAIYAVLAED